MRYRTGDATFPPGDGKKIIAHICNNVGKWGKGFVLAVSKRWPGVRSAYLSLFDGGKVPTLGTIQIVTANKNTFVVNMFAQDGIYNQGCIPPIRYDALSICLQKLNTFAKQQEAPIHMPRIGCGLAGARWSEVESIIVNTLTDVDVNIWSIEKQ